MRSITDRTPLIKPLEAEIFSDRKLFDEEFEPIFLYLLKEAISVEINISHLDDWSKNEWFLSLINNININQLKKINFGNSYDRKESIKRLKRNLIGITHNEIRAMQHNEYLSFLIDNRYKITGVPYEVKVLNDKTFIHKINFYMEVLIQS